MGGGEELVFQLFVNLLFGGITAAIASSKGRNTVGWFFLGFFFSCIALIIIACLPNLREEAAKWKATEIEQRRLREQLRQEQLKNKAMRKHTAARLDIHDQKLGIDTRNVPVGLPPGTIRRPTLLSSAHVIPPPGLPEDDWFTNEGGSQQGPYPYKVLFSRARQGMLPPDTLVWVDGMEQWQPADTIPNLFPP